MINQPCNSFLFTDFYQLTMLQLYYHYGLHKKAVLFDYFFRNYPDYGEHAAGYCINAGLETFCQWVDKCCFTNEDIDHLRNQKSASGHSLFTSDFLEWLSKEDFLSSLTIHSIPEGRVIHVNEPVITIKSSLATAQLLESSLLNHINFQVLIATKASRIHLSGEGRPLIEFGLRRSHGTAADSASRAALIGGADFSSNTALSYSVNLEPKGTHAHSLVQLFIALGEGELGAFKAYAEIYPDDCLLLVDTINTLESGIPNAIKVFESLRKKGHKPLGVRLDSGDLAYLAVKTAQMLNSAGFENTTIVLSNNIDELILMQILKQIRDEAPASGMDAQKIINRLSFGVGTRLVTSWGHAALDGVYKLVAVEHNSGWIPTLKIADSYQKAILPGPKRLFRIYDNSHMAIDDLICLDHENVDSMEEITLRHPFKSDLYRFLYRNQISQIELMQRCIYKDGSYRYTFPPLSEIRAIRDRDLQFLNSGVKRIINPHIYHVSISDQLWNLRNNLLKEYLDSGQTSL